nr:uncharacterized protein CTRU02_12268 [Colletotrichum truncatum]KAF6784807.1 hypothetical protein CTRU02_12268 [Colletotrichum truncatum]
MSSGNGTLSSPLDPNWAAESNTARIIAVVTAIHLLALTSVGLRLYVRLWVIKSPWWDDWTIILASLCAAGGWVVFLIQANHGLGKHFLTINKKHDYVVYQKAGFWQSIISAGGAFMWLKVSIALSLLRLTDSNWYKGALRATIAFTVVYCVGGMFPFFLHCRPMSGFWDKSINPKCADRNVLDQFGVVNTGLNILTDIVLAALPVPIIMKLQMKRRIRAYVIGILSLGYFAVAIGIVKAVYQINAHNNHDSTFNQSVQFWGFLQLQLGIIAACAPTLKPLLRTIRHCLQRRSHVLKDYSSQLRSKWESARGFTSSKYSGRSHHDTQRDRHHHELQNWTVASGGNHHSLGIARGETSVTATSQSRDADELTGQGSMLKGSRPERVRGIIKATEVIVEHSVRSKV